MHCLPAPNPLSSDWGDRSIPPRLEHWSYDHPANPWLGGGGAYRDWTLLEALKDTFQTTYVGAAFRGCQSLLEKWPGTEWVGGGRSPGAARLKWMREGRNRLHRLEREGKVPDLITTSPSILAPMPCLRHHLDRTVIVMHHFVGWHAWRNVGPLVVLCMAYERAIARHAKHFIVVNRKVEARIRSANPDARVERIPNGIDAALLETPRRPDPTPLLVFVGRLDTEMKGLDRLLDAFGEIAKAVPDARLEIAGRGSACDVGFLRTAIAKHPAGDRIGLRTDISEAEKSQLLSRAWLFVSPSRFEGWCIAAVEAQGCGVPVVASTADGFLDSVLDGRSGVLVPNCEHTIRSNLRDTVVSLLADPDRRSAMGREAHAWACKHTWASLADRNRRFLLETLETAKS